MRDLATLILSLSLIASAAQAGLLHVHTYEDDAHHDHQHGLSAHTHVRADAPSDDPRLEPCDPAAHLNPLIFTSVEPDLVSTGSPAEVVPAAVIDRTISGHAQPADQVRVHGPPLAFAGLRAPPLPPA